MIYANYNGVTIKATKELPYYSEGARYYCTNKYCMSPELILKKGSKKFPHFAHFDNTSCNEPEPETFAHAKMKEFLQNLLEIPDEYMEFGNIQGVRPDLLYDKKYAIEVQHSPISTDEMIRRNNIYCQNQLIPIWIFHSDLIPNEDVKEGGMYCAKYLKYYVKGMNTPFYERKLRDVELYINGIIDSVLYFIFTLDDENLSYQLSKTMFGSIIRESEWCEEGSYDDHEYIHGEEHSVEYRLKTVKDIINQEIFDKTSFLQYIQDVEEKWNQIYKNINYCEQCSQSFRINNQSEKQWKKLCPKCYYKKNHN